MCRLCGWKRETQIWLDQNSIECQCFQLILLSEATTQKCWNPDPWANAARRQSKGCSKQKRDLEEAIDYCCRKGLTHTRGKKSIGILCGVKFMAKQVGVCEKKEDSKYNRPQQKGWQMGCTGYSGIPNSVFFKTVQRQAKRIDRAGVMRCRWSLRPTEVWNCCSRTLPRWLWMGS